MSNINIAIAQANRLQRAHNILREGYTFHKDADSEVVAVCKPGDMKATYWINMLTPGCDCPDSMKGNICKHELAWNLLQEEEANLEFQCAMFDNAECASGVDSRW